MGQMACRCESRRLVAGLLVGRGGLLLTEELSKWREACDKRMKDDNIDPRAKPHPDYPNQLLFLGVECLLQLWLANGDTAR